MPILSLAEAAQLRAKRILVAGASGAGKSTLAAVLAEHLELPYAELDSLFHGENWTPRPRFIEDVKSVTSSERWVSEWGYREARALMANRAELLIFLDYSRSLVMRRVIARTVRRRIKRIELWNGNREGSLLDVFRNPDHIINWAWKSIPKTRAMVQQLPETHPSLNIVTVRNPQEAKTLVSLLTHT